VHVYPEFAGWLRCALEELARAGGVFNAAFENDCA